MFRHCFRRVHVTGATLLLALSPAGLCQTPPDSKAEPASSDTIEEIIVYGYKSLGRLRIDMYKAEVKFFDLFNAFNSDNEFDIHCRQESRTGTRIKKRVCKPNYMDEIIEHETQSALRSGIRYRYPVALIRRKDTLLQTELDNALSEQPTMAEALRKFTITKALFDSEFQDRCDGRVFLCRR